MLPNAEIKLASKRFQSHQEKVKTIIFTQLCLGKKHTQKKTKPVEVYFHLHSWMSHAEQTRRPRKQREAEWLDGSDRGRNFNQTEGAVGEWAEDISIWNQTCYQTHKLHKKRRWLEFRCIKSPEKPPWVRITESQRHKRVGCQKIYIKQK